MNIYIKINNVYPTAIYNHSSSEGQEFEGTNHIYDHKIAFEKLKDGTKLT